MKQRKFTIQSDMDGLKLFGIRTEPDGEARGMVFFAHGMAEHKERYLPFMEYLSDHGYVCCIHDHRGHGESVKSPEDLGYFYENGKEAIVEDLYQVIMTERERFPDLKVFLFGHSMGSLVVRCFTKKYDDAIDGLIVCGSPSDNPATPAAIALCKLLCLFRGDHAKGKLIHKLAFGSYLKDIEDPQTKNDWLSYNRANVTAYEHDPLCGFVFTLNGFLSLFGLIQDSYSLDGWQLKNPDLPVFFISGEEDPYRISKEAFESAVKTMRDAGYASTKAKLYPRMRHEILNEGGKLMVYEDVLELLDDWN